jgi:hypothetical protein
MLPDIHHEVRKDLRIVDVRGRISILGWCDRCRHMVLLELMNLAQEVVNHVVSVCESNSIVMHLPVKILQLLLHVLDLQVLHGLQILKLIGINLGSLLYRPQKDTVLK